MNTLAVIPARYGSTRLPGKALISLGGKPMIQRVWERVRQASSVSDVVVATDDERIRSVVQAFGGEAVMTRADHRSGTERVAEVAVVRSDAEIIVNVQGDEPLIEPAAIDAAVEAIREDAEVNIATLAVPIRIRPRSWIRMWLRQCSILTATRSIFRARRFLGCATEAGRCTRGI